MGDNEIKRRYLFTAVSLAVYVALKLGIPRLPLPHSPFGKVSLLLLSVLLFMAVQIALVRWVASLQIRPWVAGIAMAFGGSLFFAARKFHWPLGIGTELSLIVLLCMLGYLFSLILREPNLLLPAALFAPMFDIWTVFWGPAHTSMQKAPTVVEAVSTSVPAPGSIKPISMIGPGDIVFLTLFFAAIYRFKMNDRRTYWFALPLLVLTMTAVLKSASALPALVPMGIAVIAANWRLFKLTRQEKWSLAVVALIVIGFVAFAALR